MTGAPAIPALVFTLWQAIVVLALVLFVPLSVYMLHTLWRATASVGRYSRDCVPAARAIATHTASLGALDQTIEVAGEVLAAAESVAGKLGTIAAVLEARSRRG